MWTFITVHWIESSFRYRHRSGHFRRFRDILEALGLARKIPRIICAKSCENHNFFLYYLLIQRDASRYRIMTIIKEYRITLPITVEEYQVAQLYSVAESSKVSYQSFIRLEQTMQSFWFRRRVVIKLFLKRFLFIIRNVFRWFLRIIQSEIFFFFIFCRIRWNYWS